ncbi:MAG: hypothetical protein BWK75_03150 [Candidatus Altiarchaeales archaeon A3]|nr:MAG: hypothetical protein BWK75_03150 [Candidatus Altiarchaeales archaeon A3]
MIKIIGTGHVLQKSVNEVRKEISELKPNFVTVELDKKRYEILKENNFDLNFEREHSLSSLFSNPSNILSYLLAEIQMELGKKFNVVPGAEMREAILCAREINAGVVLIDRDISITINRLLNLPLNEKIKMLTISPKMTKDINFGVGGIEGILELKNLEKITKMLKKFPKFYNGLIAERDIYMAMNLYLLQSKFPYANIVAVVGAGHKEGIEKFLNKFEKEGIMDINVNGIKRIEKISLSSHITNVFFVFVLMFAFLVLKISK